MIKKILGVLVLVIILIGVYVVVKPKPAQAPAMKMTAQITPVAKQLTLDIKNNKLTNSTNKFSFTQGDTVSITITSDTDGEVHFHGYDKHVDATKSGPVHLQFNLDTAGNFPFELEETSTELGTLIVNPK